MSFLYALIAILTMSTVQDESIAQQFFNQSKQNTLMRIAVCKYQTKKLDNQSVIVKWDCPWDE